MLLIWDIFHLLLAFTTRSVRVSASCHQPTLLYPMDDLLKEGCPDGPCLDHLLTFIACITMMFR